LLNLGKTGDGRLAAWHLADEPFHGRLPLCHTACHPFTELGLAIAHYTTRRALLRALGLLSTAPIWAEAMLALAGRNVIVLGNSVVHGVGASSEATGCASVAALAIGGTVGGIGAWVGGSQNLSDSFDQLVAGPTPDLVVVHTATRDLPSPDDDFDAFSSKVGGAISATCSNVARLHDRWRDAAVVVLGPWFTAAGHPLDLGLAQALADRCGYLSLSPFWAPQYLNGAAGDHPNDAGHAAIGGAIARVAQPSLPMPTLTPTPTATPRPSCVSSGRSGTPVPTPLARRVLLPLVCR
jgi:hypothetical protein